MKRIFYYVWHTFNKNKCKENAFMFYGCYFCEKCKRNIDKLLNYKYV